MTVHSDCVVLAGVHEEVEGALREATGDGVPSVVHSRGTYGTPQRSIVERDDSSNGAGGLAGTRADILVSDKCTVHSVYLKRIVSWQQSHLSPHHSMAEST